MNYEIHACIFKAEGRTNQRMLPNQWEQLERGFRKSVKNTTANVTIHELPTIQSSRRVELATNHYKLEKWKQIVKQADKPLVLCDIDLCFLDDIADGFTDKPITLTKRSRRWCNAGVVFVRPGKEANAFFERWYEKDTWLHEGDTDVKGNPMRLKEAWRKTKVMGHNQTALACIREEFDFGWVDGKVYNASLAMEWKGDPKVVHVKDSLRIDLLKGLARGQVRTRFPITKKIVEYYR